MMPKRRRFLQSRLADLRDAEPRLLPEPTSPLLEDPSGAVHEIEPGVVGELGLRVESRYVLARGTDGRPHLWLRRQRLPRPPGAGPRLRFDPISPDHREAASHSGHALKVGITADSPTESAPGVTDFAATVTVENEGAEPVPRAVLLLQADRGGFIEPVRQVPTAVGPLEPGAATTVRIEATLLHDHPAPAPAKLRALVGVPGLRPASPGLGSTDVTVGAEGRPWDLRLELGPPEPDMGPLRHRIATLSSDDPLGSARIRVEARSQLRPGWHPVTWDPLVPPAADDRSIDGRITLNARQIEPPIELRAWTESAPALVLRMSEPVALDDLSLASVPSPLLEGSLELRDTKLRPPFVEALVELQLTNAGDAGLDDARIEFEQRREAPEGWRWQTIEHVQRGGSAIEVEADSSAALPMILRLLPPSQGVVFLRARVASPTWALHAALTRVWIVS